MSTIEHHIIEQFYKLDNAAQARVRAIIGAEQPAYEPDTAAVERWLAEVLALREQMREHRNGVFPQVDVVDMLRHSRDA